MESTLLDATGLFVRWFHLVAGIAWIGSSFYFVWLDQALRPPKPAKKDVEGSLWMVHSGGFYEVEKRKIAPGQLPKVLHWFKWEALFTWVSGVLLLGLVYYTSSGMRLIDPAIKELSHGEAVVLAISAMLGSWLIYDAIWKHLGKKHQVATVLSVALLFGLVFTLCQTFSGRGAFIHVGAILGTLMVANVWMRILPAQRQMIEATQKGKRPDYNLGNQAKRRSMHNSYMTLPVLFIMLSNHYAFTYGHELNWLVLILLMICGASVRHLMIVPFEQATWVMVPLVFSLIGFIALVLPKEAATVTDIGEDIKGVQFSQVQSIIQSRCVACHAKDPIDKTFGPVPGGVSLETPRNIKLYSDRIRIRAVLTKTMPIANKTMMTDKERAIIGSWIRDGAKVE